MQQPSNCDKEGRSLAERAMLAIINDFIFRSLAAAACRQILPADGGVNAGSKFQQENVFCKVLAVPRAAPGQSSAMMIAIQQAFEFLASLLILPARAFVCQWWLPPPQWSKWLWGPSSESNASGTTD
jgi:hypothetical protein